MRGVQHIEISNRNVKFKFDLVRNITIVRGKSGTGKTTLFDMVADYTRLKEKSGVNISSPKSCVALIDIDWKNQLKGVEDSIVFIDEGAAYIRTVEFAEAIRHSGNYYVIFTRENLHNLPYSVQEIYEIKTSGKQHTFRRLYKSNKHRYYGDKKYPSVQFDTLVTEDSKSGLQFYKVCFEGTKVQCFSAGSNSSIYAWLKAHEGKRILVIADGAAFGPEIDRVLKLKPAISFDLCLPESFEWLILKSGLIKERELKEMLEQPSDYIDSAAYFSWENFFERYLISVTRGKHYRYSKSELNNFYAIPSNAKKIISEIYDEA